MAKRISDITRFTTYAQTASESELDFMMQVLKAIKDARFAATKPAKPRAKRSDAGKRRGVTDPKLTSMANAAVAE